MIPGQNSSSCTQAGEGGEASIWTGLITCMWTRNIFFAIELDHVNSSLVIKDTLSGRKISLEQEA